MTFAMKEELFERFCSFDLDNKPATRPHKGKTFENRAMFALSLDGMRMLLSSPRLAVVATFAVRCKMNRASEKNQKISRKNV